MKKIALYSVAIIAFAASCKSTGPEKEKDTKTLSLELQSKSGSNVKGKIQFTQNDDVVKMVATMSGLKPGIHAIHIHENSDCSAADGTSAGGHWNPTHKSHGKWGSASYHKGDIGNFNVGTDGKGTITFSTDEWCIGCEDETKNIVGKSIIVHEGKDDFVTQPTGDAGGRVACTALIQ